MHSGYALWKLRVSFQCCALGLSVVVHSLHTLWKCAITQSVHKWKTGLLVQCVAIAFSRFRTMFALTLVLTFVSLYYYYTHNLYYAYGLQNN